MSSNITRRIPIAIGIKPDQTATFTNKTIDCASGSGNTISNIPNSSLQNSYITINNQNIPLGGSITIVGGGGESTSFVGSLTAGSNISVVNSEGQSATTGNLTISASLGVGDLENVSLSNLSTGNLLGYNGSSWVNTTFTETDPVFAASDAAGIAAQDITNWNTAHGWGDHGQEGYLTSTGSINTHTDVTISSVSTDQVLSYNGTAWVNTTPGKYLQTRKTAAGTASNLDNGDSANLSISTAKSYILLKVQTSAAAWVTIYSDTTSRTADSSRLETEDPLPGSGVIAEVITSGNQTQLITPGIIGFNNDPTVGATTYLRVVSKNIGVTNITVTLTYLQLEV